MIVLLVLLVMLVETTSDSSNSDPTWFDASAAEKQLLETGVSDLDVLMNFLRPEMVKRLTENEGTVVSKLEIDVGEAEKDLIEIRDESSSILSILENIESGTEDSQDPETLQKLRASVHNLVSQMHQSLEHLNVAKTHLETHEQELRHVRVENILVLDTSIVTHTNTHTGTRGDLRDGTRSKCVWTRKRCRRD